MDVSENGGTHKSSILIGFSIINHTFWGTRIFGNIHITQPFMDFFSPQILDVSPSVSWAKGTSAVLFQAKDTNS